MARFKSIEEEGGIYEHIRKAGKDPDEFAADVHTSINVYGRINNRWLAIRHGIGWDRAGNWAMHIIKIEQPTNK